MPEVNVKEIREKVNVMNDAWFEGAKDATFSGTTQTAFQTAVEAAAAKDAAIADARAQLNIMIDERDDDYAALDQLRSRIGQAVAGDPNFGNDSPLYGAMGFVRKSDRASGLTRKTKS